MIEYQTFILITVSALALLALWNLREYRRFGPEELPSGSSNPLVSILIPARNEEANIAACLAGVTSQEYSRLEILVLDDGSEDGTGHLAAELLATLPPDGPIHGRVISGQPLPEGWGGKTHACSQLATAATGDWLLFLDADTRVAPGLVRSALAAASEMRADLVSTFPRQRIGSLGEALTVPFLFWAIFLLLPIRLIRGSRLPGFAAACGQLLMVEATAYRATGGHGAIPESLHDGLHLARLFKRCGRSMALVDLSAQISCRMYQDWGECWNGFRRNAYQGLGSPMALLLFTSLEFFLFLAPFFWMLVAAATGFPAWTVLVAVQVAVLLAVQMILRRRFGYPWTTVWLHPVGIACWLAIQWSSFLNHRLKRTVLWKARPTGRTRAA